MKAQIALMIMFSAAAACSKSEATQNKKDVPPAAPAADPMTMFEKSGDKLAGGDNLTTKPLRWHDVVLAAIDRPDDIIIRAYTANGPVDVSESLLGGEDVALSLGKGGTFAVYHTSSQTGREPEVGAVFEYNYWRIDWDAKAGKPVIGAKWSCDESTAPECKAPEWTKDLVD